MKVIIRTWRSVVPLLPGHAQRFLYFYIVITSLLSLIDVAALGLLAVSLGAMAIGAPVHLPIIGEIPVEGYPWILLVVSLLIIVKSAIALFVQWIATRRFATYDMEVGDRLFSAYIRAPWAERMTRNGAQLVRLADAGIASTIAGFLLPVISLPALLVTFVLILVVLVIAQPATAFITIAYLGGIALFVSIWLSRKSVQAGRVYRTYASRTSRLMLEMYGALKEITLANKSGEVAAVVRSNRSHSARARSNMSFLGQVPRFILDAALVGGFLLVGGFAYLQGGLTAAFAAVALFGVAGVRLVPSLTGFQSVLSATLSNVGNVEQLVNDIGSAQNYEQNPENVGGSPLPDHPGRLQLRQVGYTYAGSARAAVTGVDLTVPFGTTLALVGSSGAGKSTLVDLLLGLLEPTAGDIRIDGVLLHDVLADWRAHVGYVPQDVALFDGTIAQNVALSWSEDIDHMRVERALRRAQLWSLVESRAEGMDSRIGERGLSLSGGQRQRLGIARALYREPLVLVMDEATSALDTKTEADVALAIKELRGELTIISVAHRLSTIRDNDQICFMRDGAIVARGTFAEVVAAAPDFAEQAALAGLAR